MKLCAANLTWPSTINPSWTYLWSWRSSLFGHPTPSCLTSPFTTRTCLHSGKWNMFDSFPTFDQFSWTIDKYWCGVRNHGTRSLMESFNARILMRICSESSEALLAKCQSDYLKCAGMSWRIIFRVITSCVVDLVDGVKAPERRSPQLPRSSCKEVANTNKCFGYSDCHVSKYFDF